MTYSDIVRNFENNPRDVHTVCGEHVSEEATKITVCQVYWYGILAELGLK